jgi:hypothetical protein
MMNVRKLVKVSQLADKESGMLAATIRRNTFTNTVSRTKLFKEEEKLQKIREETFSGLAKALGEKDKDGLSGALLGVLGIGGAGRFVRRFRGGGGGGLRGGGGTPKLPKGPLAKSLSKFGRIGPLAIASTGLDFFARKQSGQSNLQASGGALAGLGGFAGGAKLGALLGTAIMPGVGTAAGGLIGGALGGLVGGNLFDRLYGQNRLRAGADFRRVEEIERTRQQSTLFGENLDKFEIVLDKFAKKAPRFREQEEEENFIAERIRKSTEGVPLKNRPNALMKIIDTLFDAAIIIFPAAAGKKTVIKKTLANILMSKKARTGSKFLKFSKDASKIKPETFAERFTRAFNKKFPRGFKPELSKKGLTVRQNSLFKKNFQNLTKNNPEFQFMDFIRASKLQSPNQLKGDLNRIFKLEEQKLVRLRDLKKITQKEFEKRSNSIFKKYKEERVRIDRYELELEDLFDKLKTTKKIQGTEEGSKVMNDVVKNFRKIKKKNINIEKDVFANKEGGVISGPESGYLVVLHGRERIIPEENQYTRSKGNAQNMKTNTVIMMGDNNNQSQATPMMASVNKQIVPIMIPANPFDVASKYSELIAKVTV